ncbi:MAG: DUF3145 domain-containing protein [Actinomycetia bacterium]|nr:DUF3145 domain-containing protein [Actinomycetes bacterium]
MSSVLKPLHPADATTPARGVVYVHSCPRALSPHVEWALAEVLGLEITVEWTPQIIASGTVRGELSWQAAPGTGAMVASALGNFAQLRYEVTEEPTPAREGERFSVTPSLGMFRATIGIHGDLMISEDRIKAAIAEVDAEGDLQQRLGVLLGTSWDEELEPFRYAGEGNSVRWLHRVG